MEINVGRLRELVKEMDEILSGAKQELNDKYREFISSYVAENGSVLDEIKQLKEIGVSYGYIASDKSWKDIRIEL